uniref:Uncharacterized protein n=1 Tax=Arundo donax TaxID=35708 RepID=A0A0A9CLC5_ARUDO
MTVHPSAQMSAAVPCSSPRAASGAMNIGVPPLSFLPAMQLPPFTATRRAQPKSAIMARPSAPMSTFRPLTSQCATPAAWT